MSEQHSTNGNGGVPLIKMENIGRRFGNVIALENVNFEVGYQEVIGLLGDNGAGKSTLIKVLTGVHPPTSGQIYFEGQPVNMTSPQDARELGIETVYQDLALVPLMNISRNFYLGREPTRSLGPLQLLDKELMDRSSTAALLNIGIHIRGPQEPVGTLSGGERQSIAIGRAVHFGTKLLIMDEPTSALSIGETRKVISYTTEAKRRGISVIFITHNIHHVFEVADRFTIISHGHKVGDFRKEDVTQDEVAGMIMGEPVPERLKNRELPSVNTRPIEVRSTMDGTAVDTSKVLTVKQREAVKRNQTIGFAAIIVLIYALMLGAIYFYSRPEIDTGTGIPPLEEQETGPGFVFFVPKSWRVDRSEVQIRHVIDEQRNYAMTVVWDSVRKKNISPSVPLSKTAAALQLDDVTPRKFSPGTDITISGRPAYRSEWVNDAPKVLRSGVTYYFIDGANNFYEATIDGPTEAFADHLKPLADAIMASFAFK
jgi:simple sugar transport system ATP-binding protein